MDQMPHSPRLRPVWGTAAVGGAVALTLSSWAFVPQAVEAAPVSQSFTNAGPASFPVPAGICFVTVTATGGGGGASGGTGGRAAVVGGRVAVTAGSVLTARRLAGQRVHRPRGWRRRDRRWRWRCRQAAGAPRGRRWRWRRRDLGGRRHDGPGDGRRRWRWVYSRFRPARRGGGAGTVRGTELEDIYEIRMMLEPVATARAARSATGASRRRVIELLVAMETETDATRWAEHNARFHNVIDLAGNSPRLVAIRSNLRELSTLASRTGARRAGPRAARQRRARGDPPCRLRPRSGGGGRCRAPPSRRHARRPADDPPAPYPPGQHRDTPGRQLIRARAAPLRRTGPPNR